MKVDFSRLTTEQRNMNSTNLDQSSVSDILKLMNDEDQKIADAIKVEITTIEKAIDLVHQALVQGGRLIYLGAGTSGRLAVLDAVECPPTFRTPDDLVQGVIAGGESAMFKAVEGAEDNQHEGARDLMERGFSQNDVLIGIAASGRTPYVIGALKYAQKLGAKTIALTGNKSSALSTIADISIELNVGPEVLTGSTRLKVATAHKMVLNMISTCTMVRLGKAYENYMVDLHASNEKLKHRAESIVLSLTGESEDYVKSSLLKANYDVKLTLVMLLAKVDLEEARQRLADNDGFVREAIFVKEKG